MCRYVPAVRFCSLPSVCGLWFLLPVLLMGLAGCDSLDPATAAQYMDSYVKPQRQVEVQAFSPVEISRGALVAITGKNFSSQPALNRVIFPPNEYAPVIEASETRLVVATPPKATTGKIIVQSGLWRDTSMAEATVVRVEHEVTSVREIIPSRVRPGLIAVVAGSGFSPVPENNIVYLGSRRATVTEATANKLTIIVPDSIQPDYVVVRFPYYTAITDNKYSVYEPGAPLAPRFCRMTLKDLSIGYRDHEYCNEYCGEEVYREGTISPMFITNFYPQNDTLWTTWSSGKLVFDRQALLIRDGELVMGGEAAVDMCELQYEVHMDIREPIPVTAMPAEGHFKVVLSGNQIEKMLGVPMMGGSGDFWVSKCICMCTRYMTSYKFLPEATLTIEFWY